MTWHLFLIRRSLSCRTSKGRHLGSTNRTRIGYNDSPEGYRRSERDHWLGMNESDGLLYPRKRGLKTTAPWMVAESQGVTTDFAESFLSNHSILIWKRFAIRPKAKPTLWLTNAKNPLDHWFTSTTLQFTTRKQTTCWGHSTRPISHPITGGEPATPEVAHEDRSLFSTQRWRLWPFGSDVFSSLTSDHVFVDGSLCWPQPDLGLTRYSSGKTGLERCTSSDSSSDPLNQRQSHSSRCSLLMPFYPTVFDILKTWDDDQFGRVKDIGTIWDVIATHSTTRFD